MRIAVITPHNSVPLYFIFCLMMACVVPSHGSPTGAPHTFHPTASTSSHHPYSSSMTNLAHHFGATLDVPSSSATPPEPRRRRVSRMVMPPKIAAPHILSPAASQSSALSSNADRHDWLPYPVEMQLPRRIKRSRQMMAQQDLSEELAHIDLSQPVIAPHEPSRWSGALPIPAIVVAPPRTLPIASAPRVIQPPKAPRRANTASANVITASHLDTTLAILRQCWPVEAEWAVQEALPPPTLPVGTTSVDTPQSIPLADFIQVLLMRSHTSLATLQLALYYSVKAWAISIGQQKMMRNLLLKASPLMFSQLFDVNANGMTATVLCPRRTFLVCLILANKFLHDKSYSNRAWASITNLAASHISLIERDMLQLLNFDLFYSRETMQAWQDVFAALAPPDATSSQLDAVTPSLPLSPHDQVCETRPVAIKRTRSKQEHDSQDQTMLLLPGGGKRSRKDRQWVQHLSPPITPDARAMTSPPVPELSRSTGDVLSHVNVPVFAYPAAPPYLPVEVPYYSIGPEPFTSTSFWSSHLPIQQPRSCAVQNGPDSIPPSCSQLSFSH